MKNKLFYTQPTADLVEVKGCEAILTVSTEGNTINDATIDKWEGEL